MGYLAAVLVGFAFGLLAHWGLMKRRLKVACREFELKAGWAEDKDNPEEVELSLERSRTVKTLAKWWGYSWKGQDREVLPHYDSYLHRSQSE